MLWNFFIVKSKIEGFHSWIIEIEIIYDIKIFLRIILKYNGMNIFDFENVKIKIRIKK